MPLGTEADQVVLHGFWLDEETGVGVLDDEGNPASVRLRPVPLDDQGGPTPNVKDFISYAHIRTRTRTATLDGGSGYYAVLALANDDPDLDAYGGREVTFEGYPPYVVQVPWNAPTTTVDAKMAAAIPTLVEGDTVRALWMVEAPTTAPPPVPVNAYYTAAQVLALLDGLGSGGGGGTAPDATTSTKGIARLLGGTAASPTVPYSAVTGGPASLPPSGGAGGVLSGSYPNPGFAVDMATQTELDAGLSAKMTRLNEGLLSWAYGQTFRLVTATRDANDAITNASVVWPDGSTGTFTTDTASSTFPGAVDAYHVTYVPSSGPTRTITQSAVTRNAGGAVIAQPALAIA